MKCKSSANIVIFLGIVLMLMSSVFAQEKKIVYTTLDIKQDYNVISIITGFTAVETQLFKDPFEVALKNAWKDFNKKVKSSNADAVVGIRIVFENITKGNAGRLIIYGTAVKFKTDKG